MTILPLSSQIAPKMSGSRPKPAARNIEQPVQVVELDAKLEVLLDDVLDRDRRAYLDAPGMAHTREQGLGVAFDRVVRHVGNSKGHPRFILICIVERRRPAPIFPWPSAPAAPDGPCPRPSAPSPPAGNRPFPEAARG